MAVVRFEDGIRIGSQIILENNPTVSPGFARSQLQQESLGKYPMPWHGFRVHDAYQTALPGTPAADDLGLIGGTFATDSPSLQTSDQASNGGATSMYARMMMALPVEYDTAEDVVIRLHAGMLTTVADTTATADVECFKSDEEAGIGSDLCTTAAQSINSLTLADKDFTISAGGLSPGDILDIRLTITINDSATGTVVKGIIGAAHLLCDVRG